MSLDPLTLPSQIIPIHVVITREMWSDFYTLILDNGYTEELEIEDIRSWFKVRGANMDVVEKALDQAWNFLHSEVEIASPKEPPVTRLPHSPDI